MKPKVVPAGVDVRWDPNAPAAALLALDDGRVALALHPHVDDLDVRTVVLRWDGVVRSSMSADNDEGLVAHRLYDRGLQRLLWLGAVENTDWTWHQPWRRELRHFITPLKECVVEVLAENVTVLRSDRPPALAAAATLS